MDDDGPATGAATAAGGNLSIHLANLSPKVTARSEYRKCILRLDPSSTW